LTVIATALLILAIQQLDKPASAQIGSQCGGQQDIPCYIKIDPGGLFGNDFLTVDIGVGG